MTRPLVLKFGGELLEDRAHLAGVVAAVTTIAATGTPLVVVHGGGKEIDAALKVAGIDKRQVDGLRITDDRTLDVVVSVLAGAVNTRFVAALTTAGVPAVGLTGADGAIEGIAKRYRVAYQMEKRDPSGAYDVTHSSAVYIFDSHGHARLLATESDSIDTITNDVRRVIELSAS